MTVKRSPPSTEKTKQPYACRRPFKKVYGFKITLQEVEPVIWRQLEVPDCYTFWDLHVAITDAFGWLDYHTDMVNWLRGMKESGFDPNVFDLGSVQFDDPIKRWKIAFDGGEMTPDMRCWEFFERNG